MLFDPDGFIAEGPGWNIFLVKDDVLMTPEPRNSLIGVSRQTTIMLAKELGIAVEEKNLGRYEAMVADEIFITSTTKALCWARTWEGQPVGDGSHYPMYDKLMAAWKAHVGIDFVAQVSHLLAIDQSINRRHDLSIAGMFYQSPACSTNPLTILTDVQAHDYHERIQDWIRKDRNRHRDQQAALSTGGGLHHASMGLRPIPNTDLYVSPICLGTMTFGTPVGQADATAIIKRCAELGVNFIDTANMYEGYTRSAGSKGEASEIIIGNALQELGLRDSFVVCF